MTVDRLTRGRRGRRQESANPVPTIAQRPFQQIKRPYQAVPIISDDQVEHIHQASLKLLSETGLDVLHDDARTLMKKAGADVRKGTVRVRFDPGLINEAIATAPSEFTLHARNPHHSVTMNGDNIVFNMMASAPNCSDTDRGRRAGNQEDYRNFLRLAQMHNILHVTGGYPVEPVDIHPSVRHLDCIQDYITLTDKAYCIYALGEDRVSDAIEMTRIAYGLTRDQMRDQACMFSIINTNSPLQLDIPMTQGLMALAEMGQLVVITPFTLAGAMAPVTIAGAITLQNAEALAGVALSQMVRPGAPVMYGGFLGYDFVYVFPFSCGGIRCRGNDVIPITCQGHRGGVCHIGGLFGEWRSIGIRCAPSLPLWYLARWVVLLNGLSPGPLRTASLLGIACILRQQSSSC